MSPRLAIIVTDAITARYLLGDQLTYLASSGIEVDLVTSPGANLELVERSQQVRTWRVPMHREIRPIADLLSLFRLYRLLRRARPDAVSASTPKAGLLGMLAAVLAGVPVRIYTVRGLRLETTRGLKRLVLTSTEKLASRCAHRVVLVSESLRRVYLDRHLASGRPTSVLGAGSSNGVDCERYQPRVDPEEARRMAVSVGLDPEAPTIGFVGRLVNDKGIGDLLEAFQTTVRQRFPTAQLLLLGDFESGDPVHADVRHALREDPRVWFAGFVDDTAPWYQLMQVLAFPSHREGFPNAPLEAAASGIPVVGYAVTGTVDAVVDGRTGTLVAPGDRAALGEALCRYLENHDLARRHGEIGRRRAVAKFDREKVWSAWRDFYLDALAGAREPENR